MNLKEIARIKGVMDREALPREVAWARRHREQTGVAVMPATRDGDGAVALYEQRPPDHVDECPLIDLREATGALFLYRRHYFDIPLVATVFDVDGTPIVALVGWQDLVAGEPVAIIDRLVANPDRHPGMTDFAVLEGRWHEIVTERGLSRSIAHVQKGGPPVDPLLRRYGFAPYAEDATWTWYVRDE